MTATDLRVKRSCNAGGRRPVESSSTLIQEAIMRLITSVIVGTFAFALIAPMAAEAAGPRRPGPVRDRMENVRDRREDVRDRREDVVDRREDRADRREDIRDRMRFTGPADLREDIADRREDLRDRAEDRADRREDVRDRREDIRDRRR
jgi:hypothetical protein